MAVPWFKLFTEARNDRKLNKLTDREHRIWFHLLCYAAEQEIRGTIAYEDLDRLALEVADEDSAALSQTIHHLVHLGILSHDTHRLCFLHFTERNSGKPSDEPLAIRERVTRYREKKRDVTLCNALPNSVTPVTPKSRVDKSRVDKIPTGGNISDDVAPDGIIPQGALPPEIIGDSTRYPLLKSLCLAVISQYPVLCIPSTGGFNYAEYEELLTTATRAGHALNENMAEWLRKKLAGSYYSGKMEQCQAMGSWCYPVIKDLVADFAKEMGQRAEAKRQRDTQREERSQPSYAPTPKSELR